MRELQQQIAVDKLLNHEGNGSIVLPMRFGKSKIVIDYISKMGYKSVLWVTPSKRLASVDIPSEVKKWNCSSTVKTLTYSSLVKENGVYDLIVLDEFQSLTPRNLNKLTSFKGRILGVTGTMPKRKDEILKALGLDNLIYEVSIDDAINMKILNNYTINVHSIPLSKEKDIEAGTNYKRFMTSEYSQYQYYNAKAEMDKSLKNILKRRRLISLSPSKEKYAKALIDTLKKEGKRFITFCSDIKQCQRLFPDSHYHSKSNKNMLDTFQREGTSYIGLVNTGSVGFTFKNLDAIIIIQVDCDNTGLTSQKIGRLLLQENKYKEVHILKLEGTKDEVWVNTMLQNRGRS